MSIHLSVPLSPLRPMSHGMGGTPERRGRDLIGPQGRGHWLGQKEGIPGLIMVGEAAAQLKRSHLPSLSPDTTP